MDGKRVCEQQRKPHDVLPISLGKPHFSSDSNWAKMCPPEPLPTSKILFRLMD